MKLSVQLYTLRDPLDNDVPGTLEKVAGIGLRYVELAGLHGFTAQEWKGWLDRAGLEATGAHVPMDQLENDLDGAIRDAKALGYRFVIVPWIGADAYAGGWAAFGERLRPIGERLREEGLTLCYHNHDFEFKNGDGLAELYGSVPSDVLQAEIDAAWVSIGGQNPVEYVRGMAGRVPLVHGKDYDLARKPQWTPAGQGTMPLKELIAAASDAGAEVLVIELDESPGDPIQAVRESYEFYVNEGVA